MKEPTKQDMLKAASQIIDQGPSFFAICPPKMKRTLIAILKEWRDKVQAENDKKISALEALLDSKLDDLRKETLTARTEKALDMFRQSNFCWPSNYNSPVESEGDVFRIKVKDDGYYCVTFKPDSSDILCKKFEKS